MEAVIRMITAATISSIVVGQVPFIHLRSKRAHVRPGIMGRNRHEEKIDHQHGLWCVTGDPDGGADGLPVAEQYRAGGPDREHGYGSGSSEHVQVRVPESPQLAQDEAMRISIRSPGPRVVWPDFFWRFLRRGNLRGRCSGFRLIIRTRLWKAAGDKVPGAKGRNAAVMNCVGVQETDALL